MAAALAGLTLVMEPPAKDAAQWNTAMQAGPIPTPEEIASYTTKLTKIMNIDIPSYGQNLEGACCCTVRPHTVDAM